MTVPSATTAFEVIIFRLLPLPAGAIGDPGARIWRSAAEHVCPDNRQELGYAVGMKSHVLMISVLSLAACGAPTKSAPPESPTTTAATPPPPQPEPVATAPEPAPAPEPAKAPPAEAVPEKCDGGWVCVKVSLATRKVEKRETKLMGDPKIESTWSK